MRRNVLSAMLGAGFEPTLPSGKGILSPSSSPNRRQQRGLSNEVRCIEAHRHPILCYHERYHGHTVASQEPENKSSAFRDEPRRCLADARLINSKFKGSGYYRFGDIA